MSAYPAPSPRKEAALSSGPYFVPGLDPYGDNASSDDENNHDPLLDDLEEAVEAFSEDEAGSFDELERGLEDLPSSRDASEEDEEFNSPEQSVEETSSSDTMTDTSDEDMSYDVFIQQIDATGRGRGRGRGRGGASARGRSRGRGKGPRGGRQGRLSEEIPELAFVNGGSTPTPRGRAAPRGEGRGAGRKGRRGPRVVSDPGFEFKELQRKAVGAFIARKFDDGAKFCIEAIHLNPEIFEAHSLLSQIYFEQGRIRDSLDVLHNGALTRRDPTAWWEVAKRIEEVYKDDEKERRVRLLQVYSNITRLEKQDKSARIARIELFRQQRRWDAAVKDCRKVLLQHPSNLRILRILGEECQKSGAITHAKEAYEAAIAYYVEHQPQEEEDGFTFSDLNTYLSLLRKKKEYVWGLTQARRLARWLLGRKSESFWDDVKDTDCEWDIEDEPRRIKISKYTPGLYDEGQYGDGLPADLRAQMGLFRLDIGSRHFDEAMRHFEHLDPEVNLPPEMVKDFDDLIRDIAEALHRHGHHEMALHFFGALTVGFNRVDAEFWRHAAISAEATGAGDETLMDYLTRAVKMKEQDSETRLKLAAIYARNEQLDETKKLIDEVVRQENVLTFRKISVRERDASTLAPYLEERLKADPGSRSKRDVSRLLADPGDRDEGLAEVEDDEETATAAVQSTDPSKRFRRLMKSMMYQHKPSGRFVPRYTQPRVNEKKKEAIVTSEQRVTELHRSLQAAQARIDEGDDEAKYEWTEFASELVAEFQSQKALYCVFRGSKSVIFFGYTTEDRNRAVFVTPKERDFLKAFGDYIMQEPNRQPDPKYEHEFTNIPLQFAGIDFPEWHLILIQYAFNLATLHNDEACYDVLDNLNDCLIFIHHLPTLITIKVAEVACALALKDIQRANEFSRWFTSEFPLCTDSYRLHALINRVYQGGLHAYSNGPQMKYFTRLVKAHDFLAMDEDQRRHLSTDIDITTMLSKKVRDVEIQRLLVTDHNAKKRKSLGDGTRAAKKRRGTNEEFSIFHDEQERKRILDPQLLTLHGNMIASNGTHHTNALVYYLRSYAAQEDNPLTLLSAGVGYLHLATKRQARKQPQLIRLAIALLGRYKRQRLLGKDRQPLPDGRLKRQREMEVHFNFGRAYHFLGLNHLAYKSYWRCLGVGETKMDGAETGMHGVNGHDDGDVEMEDVNEEGVLWDEPDFKVEAALALQMILVRSGRAEEARRVGLKYIVCR